MQEPCVFWPLCLRVTLYLLLPHCHLFPLPILSRNFSLLGSPMTSVPAFPLVCDDLSQALDTRVIPFPHVCVSSSPQVVGFFLTPPIPSQGAFGERLSFPCHVNGTEDHGTAPLQTGRLGSHVPLDCIQGVTRPTGRPVGNGTGSLFSVSFQMICLVGLH